MSTTPASTTPSNPIQEYQTTIDLSISALRLVLAGLAKSGAPKDILDGLQGTIDALAAHWNDQVTKANLEAQRG